MGESPAIQPGERLKTLNRIHTELIRAGSTDELCRLAVELGRTRLGLSRLSIWLIDPDDPTLFRGTYGIDEHGQIRDERNQQFQERTKYLMPFSEEQANDPAYKINEHVPLFNDQQEPMGHGWVAKTGLMSSEGIIGWMYVDNFLSQTPYTDEDGDIIRLYANSVGHLYQNKRMEEGLRQQQAAEQALQARMRAVNEVSIELSHARTFDELTRQAVELGRERLGFDRLSLWFMEEDGVHAQGSFGTDEAGNTRDERDIRLLINPQDLVYQAKAQGDLVVVSHQAELMDDHRQRVGTGWNAAALLWDGDRTIGWISTDNLFNKRPFTPGDQELLTLYGVSVGHLCTRKRAEEQLERKRTEEQQFQSRLRALSEVNLELTRIENFDDLTRRAVELGRERLGFDRLALWFIQDDRLHARGTYGTDEIGGTRDERQVQIDVRPTHLALHAESGDSLIELWHRELVDHQGEVVGHGWNAAALLWDGKQAMGWIAADNLFKKQAFTDSDRDVLALYGSSLGHLFNRRRAEAAAVEMAVQKERAELMTELISNLSHDLRTPLSVINTSLYLLERLTDPAQQQEKVASIKAQTARLEKLIQDILTMSRLESQPVYTLHPVQLQVLLSNLVNQYQPVVERKSQALRLEIEDDLSAVMGLDEEMERVFSNLLDNAINYTPEGGSITLRA
jgi:signal transduction histidine kinase